MLALLQYHHRVTRSTAGGQLRRLAAVSCPATASCRSISGSSGQRAGDSAAKQASPKAGSWTDEWLNPQFCQAWDEQGHLQTNPERPFQFDLLNHLLHEQCRRVGPSVLELGFGSGQVLASVAANVPEAKLNGIDFSKAMWGLAKKRLEAAGVYDRCKLFQGDFNDLSHLSPFEANSETPSIDFPVDSIVSVQALHEVSSDTRRKVFKWAKEALSEGGSLFVLDRFSFGGESLRNQYKVTWERINHLGMDRSPDARPTYDILPFDEYWASYQTKDDHAATVEQYLQEIRDSGLEAAILYFHHNRGMLVASHPINKVSAPASSWSATDMPL